MVKTKIIFLDIDGVLRKLTDKLFNKKCVDNINNLIKQTDAKVVITSTWRLNGMEFIKGNVGIYIDNIIDITPHFIIQDKNYDSPEVPRGLEIKEWIKQYTTMEQYVESYVIIDDCDDILYSQIDRFVKVDPFKGFDNKCLKEALNILNKIDVPTL